MGFTLTVFKKLPIIPYQRPPCLVKIHTKLPVLKDHFQIMDSVIKGCPMSATVKCITTLAHAKTNSQQQ